MRRRILLAVVLVSFGVLAWRFLATPAPGLAFADQGRQHVNRDDTLSFAYNSSPPTSGPHVETWVPAGIYQDSKPNGELLHSLEHGYVIVFYSCGIPVRHSGRSILPLVYADHLRDDGLPGPHGGEATTSGEQEAVTQECHELRQQLETIAYRKRLYKLIVLPYPDLRAPITLAAWRHLELLDRFDAARIERFIDYYRDQGPEQTME